jgi:DNA-directed RNA polymerase sigma subunit (sigma70/sigma32)
MPTREWPHLRFLSPGVARLTPRRAADVLQQAAAPLGLPRLPADVAEHLRLIEGTRKALARLTRREERILRLRFGIGMHSGQTREQVGRRFAATRELIQQIEARALRKLRSPSRTRSLESPPTLTRVN